MFACTTPCMYQVATVTYVHSTAGTASNTSGHIDVFDAELTFEGGSDDRQCAVEEETGFVMGVGAGRKALDWTLYPEDPDDMMWSGFNENEPQDSAPYTVCLEGGDEVSFYAEETEGDPLTADELTWGWEQDGEFYYEQSGPSEVWVEAVEPGVCNITLTLEVYAPWCRYLWQNSAHDTVRINALSAELHHVFFTSDHGVLTDWSVNFADAGGTVYDPTGWRKTPGANNPVSHRQGESVEVDVCLTASPADLPFTLSGVSGVDGLEFQGAGTSTGEPQVVQLTSALPLDAVVDVIETPIQWTLTVGGPIGLGSSGPHTVYATWGAHYTGPTLKRVDYVCTEASGADSPEAVADALWAAVADDTTSGYGDTTGWALLDGGSGDCDNQAYCMGLTVVMLGAGPAAVREVMASTNAGAGNCLDLEQRPGPQYLLLDFDTGAGYDWNVFEGCCEAAEHYYAITPKLKAENDYEMLLVLPCQQYWVTTVGDIPPGDEGWQVDGIIEEVPKR